VISEAMSERLRPHRRNCPIGTNLNTTFSQELVSVSEGDLDNGSQLGQLFGGVGLDIGDTLEVG
jgi:hypothetical protein